MEKQRKEEKGDAGKADSFQKVISHIRVRRPVGMCPRHEGDKDAATNGVTVM